MSNYTRDKAIGELMDEVTILRTDNSVLREQYETLSITHTKLLSEYMKLKNSIRGAELNG